MAPQFQKPGPLGPNFIRAWRDRKGWSDQDLANAMERVSGVPISKQTIGKIANRKQAWNQHHLEVMAEALGCHPWELIAGPPPTEIPEEDRFISELEKLELSERERRQVLQMVNVIRGENSGAAQNDNSVTPKDISID